MNKCEAASLFVKCMRESIGAYARRGRRARGPRLVLVVAFCVSVATLGAPTLIGQAQGGGQLQKPHRKQLLYTSRPGQPLTVITPNDPTFDNEMALDFPNYVGLPNYQASRPFLVILRNDTQRTARAYEVIWNVQTLSPDGSGEVSNSLLSAQMAITTPLEMRRAGGLWQNDKSIGPGQARLLSPLFNGGPAETSAFAFFNDPTQLPDPAWFSQIVPELDCVVYGDGSFAGPNTTRLLLRYFVTRDAQHDEALSVLRRLRTVPRDPQIKQVLDLRVKIGASITHPNRRAMQIYIHARSMAAQEFEEILLKSGYARLQSVAQELVGLMPPHEQFTALGGVYHRAKFKLNGTPVSPMD